MAIIGMKVGNSILARLVSRVEVEYIEFVEGRRYGLIYFCRGCDAENRFNGLWSQEDGAGLFPACACGLERRDWRVWRVDLGTGEVLSERSYVVGREGAAKSLYDEATLFELDDVPSIGEPYGML